MQLVAKDKHYSHGEVQREHKKVGVEVMNFPVWALKRIDCRLLLIT